MLAVSPRVPFLFLMIAAACMCYAQEPSPPAKPKVKVNVLNVCSPSEVEQQEISSALARIPKQPAFSADFEVDRGRSVLDPAANPLSAAGNVVSMPASTEASGPASAQFVRIRHEFSGSVPFSTVQYSFSRDQEQMVETLVFRLREPKDLLEISIEARASSVTSPAAMLATSTPAGRIKLERFGKSSVVLARCTGQDGAPPVDQSKYQSLFSSATTILSDYRGALEAKKLIPEELARMSVAAPRRKSANSPHHQ